MRNISKMSLFISLYLVQSIPTAFIKTGFQSFLKDNGFDISHISGLMGAMLLPWVLKFLWAPWVDRKVGGSFLKNKFFILLFQGLGAVMLVYISMFDLETDIKTIIYLFLIFSTISATQDIAIDGLAIRIFRQKDYGKANSIQTGGYYAGEILGGALILIIFHTYGWKMSMLSFAAFYLIPFIPVLLSKPDRRIEQKTFGGSKITFNALSSFFKLPNMKRWVFIIVLYTTNRVIASTLIPSLLKDLDYQFFTADVIGEWVGIYGNLFGFAGAVIGGLIMPALGSKKSLITYSYFKIAGVLLLMTLFLMPFIPFYTLFIICFNDFFGGLASVALFSVMMEKCRLDSAGTDFTLQASIHSVGILFAVILSGSIAKLGTSFFENGQMLIMIFSVLLSIITLMMLYRYDFTVTKKAYHHPEENKA